MKTLFILIELALLCLTAYFTYIIHHQFVTGLNPYVATIVIITASILIGANVYIISKIFLRPLQITFICLLIIAVIVPPRIDGQMDKQMALGGIARRYYSIDTSIDKLKTNCAFNDPDTSLSGITIRNSESASGIIGSKNKVDDNEQYHFYTKMERETLTLTQQPGDGKNQISVFKVEYSDKADYGYQQLPIDTLKTEKGIKLGLSKKQIVERLGTCYAALDSQKNYIELYYSIEDPNDSKTRLLGRHHMPIYYASYKLWNDKLEKFEFGFEYP